MCTSPPRGFGFERQTCKKRTHKHREILTQFTIRRRSSGKGLTERAVARRNPQGQLQRWTAQPNRLKRTLTPLLRRNNMVFSNREAFLSMILTVSNACLSELGLSKASMDSAAKATYSGTLPFFVAFYIAGYPFFWLSPFGSGCKRSVTRRFITRTALHTKHDDLKSYSYRSASIGFR